MMDRWTRIGDDQDAQFGRQSLRFEHNDISYMITVDQSDQGTVSVEHDGKSEHWPVSLKEYNGEYFKLSGQADWVPELLDYVCWFELILNDAPKITYWGDREVYRIDQATS